MTGSRTANSRNPTNSSDSVQSPLHLEGFRETVGYNPENNTIDSSRLQDGYKWVLRDIASRNGADNQDGVYTPWDPDWVFWITEA